MRGAGRQPPGAGRGRATSCEAYFARDLKEFDLPLAPAGTPFQQRVWDALRDDPLRQHRDVRRGRPADRHDPRHLARRGTCQRQQPHPVVIPCHRVIGANGTLTGFGGGLARKQVLLTLEQDTLF